MANSTIPPTARSLLLDPETDILSLVNQPVPIPKPDTDEHLIRVHATALCARELIWHKLAPIPPRDLVPGFDLAGTVILAPSSSPFKPGDQVYARTNYIRPGCARDYTITESSELALKPKNLTWNETATVALSALTAWQAFFEEAKLAEPGKGGNEGKRVFVTGASGSVGQWLLQIAREAGIHIVASCGTDSEQFVRDLGASEVVDYKKTKLADWVAADESRKVDVVIDCYGGQMLVDAWGCIKDGGRLISIVEPPEGKRPVNCAARDVANYFFVMHPDGKQLKAITKLVEDGKCRPFVDNVWKLEDFEKAFERLDSRRARGKVVINLLD